MIKNKSVSKTQKILNIIGNIIFSAVLIFIVTALFSTIFTQIKGKEPSLMGYRLYYVASGSMTPAISAGSVIIVKNTSPQKIQKSDVVTFRGSGSAVVTHRVTDVSEDNQSFTTRGDANNTNDPLRVTSENLIGKVVFHVPFIGYLLEFLKSSYGLIAATAAIMFTIILYMLPNENKKERIK